MAQWPISPAPIGMPNVGSVSPTLRSQGQSLKRQVRSRGGQRWMISLGYGPMTRAQWAPLWAFVVALRGSFGTCTFVMPSGTYDTPLGSWAGGAPLVDGAGQTGRLVNLKGFTATQSGVVKAGDFLKFADSKVYMATADANSNGAGKVVGLAIEPALIVSPADSEAVVYTSVPFTVELGSDQQEHSAEPPLLTRYSCALVEAY